MQAVHVRVLCRACQDGALLEEPDDEADPAGGGGGSDSPRTDLVLDLGGDDSKEAQEAPGQREQDSEDEGVRCMPPSTLVFSARGLMPVASVRIWTPCLG